MKVIFTDVPVALRVLISQSIQEGLANSQYEGQEGDTCWYQHVNQNQTVEVFGSTVIVEGERCALWGDHNAKAMHALSISGLKPSEYHTSDPRLQWHETLSSYMEGPRASYEEAIKHCRETERNPRYYKALEEAWEDAERLRQYPLRASAEMDKQQLERAREVLPLI